MLTWLFIGMVVYGAVIMIPSVFLVTGIGVMNYARGRDEEPEVNVLHGRAERAARNLRENMPIFLALGVLALVVEGTDMDLAVLGAQIFVLARLVYPFAYMSGVAFLRSSVWMVGLAGLITMAVALV